MTAAEAARLVGILVAGYPTAKVPDETIKLYITQLVELEPPTGLAAVMLALEAHRQFPPTFAELTDAIREAQGDAVLSPGEAWQKAITWASKNGTYGPMPPLDEPWGVAYHQMGRDRMAGPRNDFKMRDYLAFYEQAARSHERKALLHRIEGREKLALPGEVQKMVEKASAEPEKR